MSRSPGDQEGAIRDRRDPIADPFQIWLRRRTVFYRSQEAVSAPGQSLNEARVIGVVAQRFAQLVDRPVETALEIHEGVGGPEFLLDLFPGHHLAGPVQQNGQNLKRLLL